jgi:4-hydroxy-tetrahydrodipicolinate synthase
MDVGKPLAIRGCYPAMSVPFDAECRIVEDEFRALIRTIDRAPGVAGVVVNGHAGELPTLDAAERVRLVRIAREELSRGQIVIAGIDGTTVEPAIEQLKAARDAGADAALVVPAPSAHDPGGSLTRGPDVTIRYFTEIAKVGLPIVIFYRSEGPSGAYTMETLVRLSEIDEVVGVKISTFDTQVHQEGVEVLAGRLPILSAGDAPGLFGSMLLGSDGIISGAVQLCPELWARYTDHVIAGEVREAHDVVMRHLLPIVTHIYSGRFETTSSTNARTKEALVQLGIISSSKVRPPERDVTELDREHVRVGLKRAQLLVRPGMSPVAIADSERT